MTTQVARKDLTNGLEEVVYNSSSLSLIHNISSLNPTIYLTLKLWTIDLHIRDYDNKNMHMGFINIKNTMNVR